MICRLCLIHVNVENKISLFGAADNIDDNNVVKLIEKYFYIELTQQDNISTNICQECCKHLEEFHKFCVYVEQQQSTLRNEFLEVKCDVQLDTNDAIEDNDGFQNEDSLGDIKDVLMTDYTTQLPLELQLKCEPHELQLQQESNEIPPQVENNDVLAESTDDDLPLNELLLKRQKTAKSKAVRQKRTKLKIAKVKKTKKVVNKKAQKPVDALDAVKLENDAAPNESTDVLDEDALSVVASEKKTKKKAHQSSERSIEIDQFIAKHTTLKCDLCDVHFETFAQMRPHYMEQHNRAPYAVCCSVHFNKRHDLYDHINWHLNPECFKCDKCDKVLKSKYSLKMHHTNKHLNRDDFLFNCEICDKKFARPSVLNQHLMHHQATKTHTCQECNKSFINKQRLEKHIRSMHDNIYPHICDVCGQKFKFKPSFDRHVLEHQGIVQPPEQCPQCGEWLKNKDRLRLHMAKHNLVDVNCKYCGRVCASLTALRGHIQYMHRRLAKHKCTFCEKSFKTISGLKEHVATHTGINLYNCPHCAKECRSRANMYVHVKRQHPQEWLAAQLARPSKAPQTVESS